MRGVAPGASMLPIRIAGWQPSAEGGFAVYSRTDQLLAGLERAVDPDADGDVLDAARVAVIGVTEPFAAFPDGPVARAVAGAARLDTLVVVPAGNEGPAGPGYGSIGGPGGAPAALTVGAADLRRETATVRVVVRAGLRVVLDRELPLGGAVAPRTPLSLDVMRPRRNVASGPRGTPLARYFDDERLQHRRRPRSVARTRCAGRPTTPARRCSPGRRRSSWTVSSRPVRSGSTTASTSPWSACRRAAAAALRAAIARGADVRVSLGAPGWRANGRRAVDRTVLLARPRLRRRRQAGGRGGGRRARHRRSGPQRRPDGALRDDQRLERRRGARRRRGSRARTGATRARRGGPEGNARRDGRSGRPEPGRRPGRRRDRPRRGDRRRGRRGPGRGRLRRRRQGGLASRPADRGPERLHAAGHRRGCGVGGGDRRRLGDGEAGPAAVARRASSAS